MITHQVKVHGRGPALWPEHKPLPEILKLKATTPEPIWWGTWQGIPSPPGGTVFKRDWWRDPANRYDPENPPAFVGIYQSWDTANSTNEHAAYTACLTGAITADYRLAILNVWRDRLAFPELPPKIERQAGPYFDRNLKGILIEDKASGVSAYQTLRVSTNKQIRRLVLPFTPRVDKITRANQAAVWGANGSIMLPWPGDRVPWLVDFQDELFEFPNGRFMDQVDALSQIAIYTENLLAEGYQKRSQAR